MYNRCPDLLKLLLKLVTIACQTQTISSEWSKAITTFILKEKDTHDVSYFRVVALMNVEGKICKQIHRHHFPKGWTSQVFLAVWNIHPGTGSKSMQPRAANQISTWFGWILQRPTFWYPNSSSASLSTSSTYHQASRVS